MPKRKGSWRTFNGKKYQLVNSSKDKPSLTAKRYWRNQDCSIRSVKRKKKRGKGYIYDWYVHCPRWRGTRMYKNA